MIRFTALLAFGILSLSVSGCMTAYRDSVHADTLKTYTRIFLTDYNTAWQSALESLKSSRLDVSNREGGFLQTKWTDNTAEKNFIDSFGTAESYLKAQYRFKVVVAKGFYNGKPSVKVSVEKDQVIQRDVLEGWRPVATDSIDENTLLYRIGRIIWMKMKLAKLEERRVQKAMQETKF
jgi:hypothetical protein